MLENTFRELFEANSKKVFNIALNIVQSIEDAEDITQEVFMEVHRSHHGFNQKAAVSTWIYRIAVNKSINHLRAKRTRKRFAFIGQLFHPVTNEQMHETPHFDHPGVILENKELSGILFKAISKLPPNQMTAFVLAKTEGLSYKEIAETISVSEKAVESLVQRAKDNLKKILGNIYNERGI